MIVILFKKVTDIPNRCVGFMSLVLKYSIYILINLQFSQVNRQDL